MPRRSANPPVPRPPIGPDDEVDSWGRRRGTVKVRMMECDEETGEEVGWVDTFAAPMETRCRAKARWGKFKGQQCRMWAIRGGPVCRKHGGSLPNVKRAAAAKLAMAANPAIEKLIHIALVKRGVDDRDRIRAICAILDRAGITGKTEITIEVKPWQDMLRRIGGGGIVEEGTGEVELEEGKDYSVDYDGIEEDEYGDSEEGEEQRWEDDVTPISAARSASRKGRARSRG
jgi:hypothetical protein